MIVAMTVFKKLFCHKFFLIYPKLLSKNGMYKVPVLESK